VLEDTVLEDTVLEDTVLEDTVLEIVDYHSLPSCPNCKDFISCPCRTTFPVLQDNHLLELISDVLKRTFV